MSHTLDLATRAVHGPDPESALAYLELLEERILGAIAATR
jgi:hypothetical protein